jgi:heme exporter protein A
MLFQCRDLNVFRGERYLLTSLAWEVSEGEVWQIKGENGSGKTSLLRCMSGLTPQSFEGALTRTDSLLYLGHKAGVKADLTVLENVRLQLGGSLSEDPTDWLEALDYVGLSPFVNELAYRLSAGQCRRIALARLLCTKAKLWLLDEPLTAMDTAGVQLIERQIDHHIARGGAVIYTSHQALELTTPARVVSLRGEGGRPDVD